MTGTDGPVRTLWVDHCARMAGAEIAMLTTLAHTTGTAPAVFLAERGPLVPRLRALGIEVVVHDAGAALTDYSRKDVGGRLPGARLVSSLVATVRALRRCVAATEAQVVVSNSMKAHVFVALARLAGRTGRGRAGGFRHVAYLRDRVATDYMSRGATVLVRLALRGADAVVANSAATLASLPVLSAHQVRVVVPSPVPRPQEPVRESVGSTHYAVVGRLTPWKGQELALRAFAAEFAGGPEHLHVAGGALFGEEAYRASLEDLARQLGIDAQVTWHGHVDDVYGFLRGMDGLVHCSVIPEPFGQVVVQGMVTGVPVVASGEGGPAEVVTDGVDGLLFEPRSEASLAAAWRRVHDDADLRRRLRAAAAVTAEAYEAGAVAARLDALVVAVARR